ncbi:MAG: sensor histidine kinase, partial [Candidatus Omnitrophica bacterium]|nr:sensor histidine kinase [Candidatus Omnitrophota bacterium]
MVKSLLEENDEVPMWLHDTNQLVKVKLRASARSELRTTTDQAEGLTKLFENQIQYAKEQHAVSPNRRGEARLDLLEPIELGWARHDALLAQFQNPDVQDLAKKWKLMKNWPMSDSARALLEELQRRRIDYYVEQSIPKNPEELAQHSINANLRFVINEILKNAFDAYAMANKEGPIWMRILEDSNRNQIIIEISDNGIGIEEVVNEPGTIRVYPKARDMEDEDIISVREGALQIGLLWSKLAAELHGGSLEVLPNFYDGYETTVRIALPSTEVTFKKLSAGEPGARKSSVDDMFAEKVNLEITPPPQADEGDLSAFLGKLDDGKRYLIIRNATKNIREGFVRIPKSGLERFAPRLAHVISETDTSSWDFALTDILGATQEFVHHKNVRYQNGVLEIYFRLSPGQTHMWQLASLDLHLTSDRPHTLPPTRLLVLPDRQKITVEQSLFIESANVGLAFAFLAKTGNGTRYLVVRNASPAVREGSMVIPYDAVREIHPSFDESATTNETRGNFSLQDSFTDKTQGFYSGENVNRYGPILKIYFKLGPRESHYFLLSSVKNGINRNQRSELRMALFAEDMRVKELIETIRSHWDEIVREGAFVFDVDGTLVPKIPGWTLADDPELLGLMIDLLNHGVRIGFVSGSSERHLMNVVINPLQKAQAEIGRKDLLTGVTFYVSGGAKKFIFDDNGVALPDKTYNQANALSLGDVKVFRDELEKFAVERFSLESSEIEGWKEFARRQYPGIALNMSWSRGRKWRPVQVADEQIEAMKSRRKGIVTFPWIELRGSDGDHIASFTIRPMPKEPKDVRDELIKRIKKALGDRVSDFEIQKGGSSSIDVTSAKVNKVVALGDFIQTTHVDPNRIYFLGDEFLDKGGDEPIARYFPDIQT